MSTLESVLCTSKQAKPVRNFGISSMFIYAGCPALRSSAEATSESGSNSTLCARRNCDLMTTNHISYIYRRQKTPMGWWRKPRTTPAQNDVVGLSDGSYPQLDPKERPEWWWTLTLAWVADILDQCPVNPAIESRRETRLCTTTTRLCLQRKL